MNPAVRQELRQQRQSTDGVLRDYCDSIFFKQHPLFKNHPNALQLLMHYDDVEVANPLGSKAGTHKLGMCKCSLMGTCKLE